MPTCPPHFIRWLLLSLALLAVGAAAPAAPAERAADLLRPLGPWAPIAFVTLYTVLCVACLPGAFLTVAGGALFGLTWGFAYSWLGAQLGASAAFFVGRHLARDRVARRLAQHPMLAAIEHAVTVEGWRIVGLLRLAPGSPFFLLNYLFSLTRVRYLDYLWATALASIPGTLLFVYLGSLGHLALHGRLRTPWEWGLYAVGLAALVLGSVLIARRARRRLQERVRVDPSTVS
ncbi:MAG: TVP38/TMEM64 family protein [Verrucomicrobiae bacterium]|nr:TVP38/TMEM64 family protein [Verrucomicrobiae bacterium]